MLDFAGLSIFAILVAWVINVVIGSFWYSPAGFGKRWSNLSGVDMMKTPKNEANRAIILVVISSLVLAFAQALILRSLHVTTFSQGVWVSLILWFGFTAVTTIGNTLYQRKSLSFWWLNAAFFLVVMVLDGILLALWQ